MPIGDPTLTSACKELSRERDAMIFIVSVGLPSHYEEDDMLTVHVFRVQRKKSQRYPSTYIELVTTFERVLSMKLERRLAKPVLQSRETYLERLNQFPNPKTK